MSRKLTKDENTDADELLEKIEEKVQEAELSVDQFPNHRARAEIHRGDRPGVDALRKLLDKN